MTLHSLRAALLLGLPLSVAGGADAQCLLQKLSSSATAPHLGSILYQAGVSVALEGDRLFVGVQGDDVAELDGGSVLAYEHTGGSWTQTAVLLPSPAAPGISFGFRLALEGDTLAVGAADEAVYVFEHQGGSWVQTQRLTASDSHPDDGFGIHLALSGDTLLVGAAGSDGPGSGAGAAYVFERVAGSWVQTQVLLPLSLIHI